jgi:5'/3'-nucleotidase SurE
MKRLSVVFVLVFLSFCGSVHAANGLNILLSNDDGFDAPGIQAMQAAFKAAGHKVTIVGPKGNRSGSSTALTIGLFGVEKIADDVYSVDTTPAMTVKFGVAEILTGKNKPDLILSGINSGANIGPSTVISGTVGNVIAAITQLDRPIPAIAFSTDLVDPDPTSAANREHFAEVAKFAVRVVRRLTRNGKLVGLDPGEGMNINYPPLSRHAVKGVCFAQQGFAPVFTNTFTEVAPGQWFWSPALLEPKRDVPRSDTILFERGFITLVVVDADYTASAAAYHELAPYFQGLRP